MWLGKGLRSSGREKMSVRKETFTFGEPVSRGELLPLLAVDSAFFCFASKLFLLKGLLCYKAFQKIFRVANTDDYNKIFVNVVLEQKICIIACRPLVSPFFLSSFFFLASTQPNLLRVRVYVG